MGCWCRSDYIIRTLYGARKINKVGKEGVNFFLIVDQPNPSLHKHTYLFWFFPAPHNNVSFFYCTCTYTNAEAPPITTDDNPPPCKVSGSESNKVTNFEILETRRLAKNCASLVLWVQVGPWLPLSNLSNKWLI